MRFQQILKIPLLLQRIKFEPVLEQLRIKVATRLENLQGHLIVTLRQVTDLARYLFLLPLQLGDQIRRELQHDSHEVAGHSLVRHTNLRVADH